MRHLFLALFCLTTLGLRAQSFSNGFAFNLPAFDSTTQTFLPVFPKQTLTDFVSVSANGEFITAGQPIRFWGGNLSSGACFPPKADASAIAARMRKMGMNLMRFHHMDNPWTTSEGSIFLRNGLTTSLNPNTLDRMHYFLAKMKEQGVYANINLHVSRTFEPNDGVLHADSIGEFGKAVTFYDRKLIDLQKQFAQQLLGTVNPYTGLSLADDPVVAMVEITNENTLFGFWQNDELKPIAAGGILIQRHSDSLDEKWTSFLQEKYPSQAVLESAWDAGGAGPPVELLTDGGFESGNINQEWQLELHQGAAATISTTQTNPRTGSHCAFVDVTQVTGTDWHLQFQQAGFSVEKDSVYVVRFAARANGNRTLQLNMQRHNDPYTWYGGSSFQVGTQWQEYLFAFAPTEDNAGNGRISFSFANTTGDVWLDDVSVKRAVRAGIDPGETLAAGTVRRITYSERANYHKQRAADMAEFYIGLQADYYAEMKDYLVNTLGVQVPITGSNALGGLQETYSMDMLDYVDDHAYWDHPHFPNTAWSATDWLISNRSMLSEDYLGTIPQLFGGLAQTGKPYTISEYNHPSPNVYQTEMVPILAAYSAFHGADGIMFFNYASGDPVDWRQDFVNTYFEIHRNPALMALFPIFGYAYREGMIKEGGNVLSADYTPEYIYDLPSQDNTRRWGKHFPYDNRLALTHKIETRDFQATQTQLPNAQVGSSPYLTTTGEIAFRPELSLMRIHAPRIECIAGNLGNASQLSGNYMQVNQGADHGVLAWMSLTDEPVHTSTSSVITLSSRFQNQNMIWNGTTTVNNNWGSTPTAIKPLDMQLTLSLFADSIRVYPLNPSGQAQQSFTVFPQSPGQFVVDLDQQTHKSVWFGVEVFGVTTALEEEELERIQVYPNPVSGGEVLRIKGLDREANYRILNVQGQVVAQGICREEIPTDRLARGLYHLELIQEGKRRTWKIKLQ